MDTASNLISALQWYRMNDHIYKQTLIPNVLKTFLGELGQCCPLQIAASISEKTVLLWIITEDDDEETEGQIYLAQARTNAKYVEPDGFSIDCMVVEKCDEIGIPPHYQTLFDRNPDFKNTPAKYQPLYIIEH